MSGQSFLEQPELHTKAPYRAALLTYPGNLRQALRDAMKDPSKTLMGLAHGIPSVFVTKLLASTKPDFIFIDVEHGMFNRLELHDCIHAAQTHSEGKSLVIVRVPKHDEISVSTALDAGAAGLIIPHTESAQDVKDMIKAAYYPPIGQRSFSPWTFTPGVSDASLYPGDNFNIATSNRHICMIPQIESVKGVENIEEIAACPGVDAMMFGPGDFSIDAGLELKLGGVPDPVLVDAMTKFGTAAAKNDLPLLGPAQSTEMVPMLLQSGYRAIAVAFDVWGLTRLMHGSLQDARGMAQALNEAKANGNGHVKEEHEVSDRTKA